MTTLTNIEASLSADWQKAVSFFQVAEQGVATFLSKVATGAEILVEDIQAVAQYVTAHLGIINTTVSAISLAAQTIAPNNASVAKVISDLQTGTTDVANLAAAVTAGAAPSGSSTVVQDAVTTVNAVKTLSSLASQASATLATLTASSPTATTAVSAASAS